MRSINVGPYTRSARPAPYRRFSPHRTGCPSGTTSSNPLRAAPNVGSPLAAETPWTDVAATTRLLPLNAACTTRSVVWAYVVALTRTPPTQNFGGTGWPQVGRFDSVALTPDYATS